MSTKLSVQILSPYVLNFRGRNRCMSLITKTWTTLSQGTKEMLLEALQLSFTVLSIFPKLTSEILSDFFFFNCTGQQTYMNDVNKTLPSQNKIPFVCKKEKVTTTLFPQFLCYPSTSLLPSLLLLTSRQFNIILKENILHA